MRIAIDARALAGGTPGDQTYWRNLIPAMAQLATGDTFTLYHREPSTPAEALAAACTNVHSVTLPFRIGGLWSSLALPPRLRRDRMNLLHANYMLPPLAPCPTVVTIHDITFRLFPQWFSPRARRVMNGLIGLSARTATRIIVGSECSKRDIVRCFKVPPDKVIVTPYAASPHLRAIPQDEAQTYVAARYKNLTANYILGVGVRGARKNIGVVLRAILRLQKGGSWPPDTCLALAGDESQFPDPEVQQLRDHIIFLGYVPDDDLPALYSAARACVYPSLYEGFGLPPLEAMACGCPVLTSNTSSLPEVVGDAGWLLPSNDEGTWVAALGSVLNDSGLRDKLREKGLQRAALFSWERTARQTLAMYGEVTALRS
jgi:glycosyltransferase involved in cell wall biosynthesis